MEKFIIINDCSKEEMKTILKDWLVMYADRLKSKSVFEFAEIKPNSFILKVDKSLDDTDFFYLVNYFAYPIDYEKTFDVEGYATASKHKTILNKNIYVFNNLEQTEYDNVWITTEDNETYKFDFGGKLKKINYENKYKALDINNLSITYEQIIFNKKELLEELKRKKEEKSNRSLEKRFKIISTILFIGMPLTFLLNRITHCFTDLGLIMFFTVAIHFWFVIDYKIFYNIRRTLICVLLSLLLIIGGVNTNDIYLATIATISISSIIVILLASKLLGTKWEYIENKLDRLFWLILLALSVLISAFVFYPILKYIM